MVPVGAVGYLNRPQMCACSCRAGGDLLKPDWQTLYIDIKNT